MALKPLETIYVSMVSNIRNGKVLVKWKNDRELKEERRLSPSICYPHDVVPLRTERWIGEDQIDEPIWMLFAEILQELKAIADVDPLQLIHLWVLSLEAPRDGFSPSPERYLQIATAFPRQAQDRIQMTPLLQRRKRLQKSMTFAVSRFTP
jgi:hypothetical protein